MNWFYYGFFFFLGGFLGCLAMALAIASDEDRQ